MLWLLISSPFSTLGARLEYTRTEMNIPSNFCLWIIVCNRDRFPTFRVTQKLPLRLDARNDRSLDITRSSTRQTKSFPHSSCGACRWLQSQWSSRKVFPIF
jgi:hypothetical protein